jgi:hypothetical protein
MTVGAESDYVSRMVRATITLGGENDEAQGREKRPNERSHRAIACTDLHIPNLPFSKVFKYAVVPITIGITVFEPFFTRDNDNDGLVRRSYYSTLLLPSKALVNVNPDCKRGPLQIPNLLSLPLVIAMNGAFGCAIADADGICHVTL